MVGQPPQSRQPDRERVAESSELDYPPGWVSVNAVAWVLDRAPCPGPLVSTLVAFARHADQHGRGSRPCLASVARMIGKHRRQVERDVPVLVDLGLLIPGDQSTVAHIPEGQRPVVYDLPLRLSGEKPQGKARGRRQTTDAHVGGGSDAHVGSTPDVGVGGTTDAHVGQKKLLKKKGKKPLNKVDSSARTHAADAAPAVDAEIVEKKTLQYPTSSAGYFVVPLDADATGIPYESSPLVPQPRAPQPIETTLPPVPKRRYTIAKRTTDEKSCGHPGCLAGTIIVPAENPVESTLITCPNCWIGYVQVEDP